MAAVKILQQDGFLLFLESGDSLLAEQENFTKTFSLGAVLKKRLPNPRQFLLENGDYILQEDGYKILFENHEPGLTFTFGALLSRPSSTKTFTFGSVLKELSKTKTFTFGSTIDAAFEKTFTLGAVLKRVFSTNYLLLEIGDFLLKEDSGKIQLEDPSGGKSFSFGATIVARFSKTFTLGATISKLGLKTFGFGAVLTSRFDKTFTFGGVLKKLNTLKTFTLGAKISLVIQKTFTFGARIERFHFHTESIVSTLTSDEETTMILGQTETICNISTTNETSVKIQST